jgi:hypothetical protein
MTPEQIRARGGRVRALRETEAFQEAVAAVDADLTAAILATKIEDVAKREALFAEFKGFRRVVAKLRDWDGQGEVAAAEIERSSRS